MHIVLRRTTFVTMLVALLLAAAPAVAAGSSSDIAASLSNGNYGGGSGQLAANWTNAGAATFSGTVQVTVTVPASVKIMGPIYEGTCSPENTTDGCQKINYSATTAGFTVGWTGIIAPGQNFYVTVQYQAAAAIGSLAPGEIVETISDTEATDTNTTDKTATLATGGSSSGSSGSSSSSGRSSSSGSGGSSSSAGGSSSGSSSSGRSGRRAAR
jgi:hypothetical protein